MPPVVPSSLAGRTEAGIKIVSRSEMEHGGLDTNSLTNLVPKSKGAFSGGDAQQAWPYDASRKEHRPQPLCPPMSAGGRHAVHCGVPRGAGCSVENSFAGGGFWRLLPLFRWRLGRWRWRAGGWLVGGPLVCFLFVEPKTSAGVVSFLRLSWTLFSLPP